MANGQQQQQQPPEEDSLAAQIQQIEAERKARKAESDAKILLADAADSRKLGQVKAQQVLTERARARAEKQEKEQQAAKAKAQGGGGQKQPEPKDIMPPPSSLSSKDTRLDPSALPGGALGGSAAQQILSQMVGGQRGLPTVQSSETTTGIGQGTGFGGQSIFFPDVRTQQRERELTPTDMQAAQFARLSQEVGAPVPPTVAAGWRQFSPLSDPTAQTLNAISDNLGRVKNDIFNDGFEQHQDAWHEVQANYFDQGLIPIREERLLRKDRFTMVEVREIELLLAKASRRDKSATRELEEMEFGPKGENHWLLEIIAVNMARRLNSSSPQAEQAVQERVQRKAKAQQDDQETDQDFQTLMVR